jgi:succinyl-diaminopimelate desuccinylase
MLSLLKQLINISSPYPHESRLGEFLFSYLRNLGFSVAKVYLDETRFSILASRGKSPSLMFYGHLDTVPLTQTVFSRSGNKIYGLGAYDMKGGIAAFLTAVSRHDLPVKILLCPDEENYSAGVWSVINSHQDFFSGVKLIISAEPNFGLGLHSLTVARTGRYVFEMIFPGIPAHMAQYKKGKDAILSASVFIQKLYADRDLIRKNLHAFIQVRRFSAESVGMSVCDLAKIEIECLVAFPGSWQKVKKYLENTSHLSIKLKPRPTPYLDPYRFSAFPYQTEIKSIIKATTGQKMQLDSRYSVADDNALATLEIPVITWGPDGENAHSPGEWVSLDSLKKLSRMYRRLLISSVVK